MEHLEYGFNARELARLISENPNMPVVVMVDSELSNPDYAWTCATSVSYGIEEILDCECDISELKLYSGRDELKNDIRDYLFDDYVNLPDEEFDKLVNEKMAEYEPYWKKVIYIKAGV